MPAVAHCVPVVILDTISSPAVVNPSLGGTVSAPASPAGIYVASAQQFTTVSFASNLLEVAAVIGFVQFGSANASATALTLSIFSDAAGLPGALMMGSLAFTPPPNLPQFGSNTPAGVFLPTSTIALAANTT